MNRKARLAWEMYLKMETSSESFSLLQLIANDCYEVTHRPICYLEKGIEGSVAYPGSLGSNRKSWEYPPAGALDLPAYSSYF